MRAAAAEGYARLRDPADLPMIEKAWKDEGKIAPRLSLAFALVMLGKTELSEFSPLQFLIDNLNSAAYNGVAFPFLVELARDSAVRRRSTPRWRRRRKTRRSAWPACWRAAATAAAWPRSRS